MTQYCKQNKGLLIIGFILFFLGKTSQASLLGTDLSIEYVFQLAPPDPVVTIDFPNASAVVGQGVEFPELVSTSEDDFNMAINAGSDFLEIEIDNLSTIGFGPGDIHEFTFTFDSDPPVKITNATIDTSVTTLGLDRTFGSLFSQSNLTFSGNQLTINVSEVSFNTTEASTFVRIDLTSVPAPPPAPIFPLTAKRTAKIIGVGVSDVSVAGDTLVTGDVRSASVFVRDDDGVWIRQAKLTITDSEGNNKFVESVSVDADTVVIGADATYVFVRNGGTWIQQAMLTVVDTTGNSFSPDSISVDGDTVVIGVSRGNNDIHTGAAYVFARDSSGNWFQQARLLPDDGEFNLGFGDFVSVDADTVLIGADGSGAAYIFVRNDNGNWIQQARLHGDDPTAGDLFGHSVSLSGDTAVVSAIFDDIESGVAYIFVRDDSGNWNRQAKLRGQEDFGSAVSVDDDIAVFNSPFRRAAVLVFARNDVGNWIEQTRLSPDSDDQEEEFGTFLSIDGNTIVVTGVSDNGNGATYVFELQRPDGFVFLADEKVEIDRSSISAGNIHANGDIIFDKGSRGTYTGDLSAVDFIKIGKRNTIVGDASAGFSVIIDDKSTVTGTVVENTDVAVIPLPTIALFSAGKEDIKVKSGEILALAPGSYDDVRANEGATLQLMSGEYFLEELDLKDRSALEIDVSKGPVTINVEKELEFDNEVEVRITPFDEDSSNWVTFKQLGHKTVEIDKGAKVLGTIIAPKAKVELKTGSYFKGTILARTIEVKTRVTFLPHNSSDSE